MPYDHFDIIDSDGPHPTGIFKTENMLMDLLVKSDEINDVKTTLSNIKFHAGLSDFMPYSVLIQKTQNVPILKWLCHLPDPVTTVMNQNAWEMSPALPTVHPKIDLLHSLGH